MINGTHAIIYAEDATAARTFFRDVLGYPFVDVHDGWLIFKLPPAELGIHPEGSEAPSGHHELFLMCDDLDQTVAELTAKGVVFTQEIEQASFGRLTRLGIPGGGQMGIYQPRHPVAYDLEE